MRFTPALARLGAYPAAVLLPLAVASAAMGIATLAAERAVRALADGAIAGAARSISLAAERGLAAGRIPPEAFAGLFAERVVAYALVADAAGEVVLHTNPELVGRPLADLGPPPARRAPGGGGRVTLGTGLPVWVEDRPVRLAHGRRGLLRVAVATAPADRELARFAVLRWGVLGAVAALWASGGTVILLARRARRLEREAVRREELALVGQMTATLAHEIRNAVGGIKGHAQLAAERTPGEDPRSRQLELVLRGAERIEGLAAALLAFAREETFEIVPVDLREAVRSALAAVPWAGRVVVGELPARPVLADGAKLERTLVDGIRNAVEAMGEGGTLAVRAELAPGRAVLRIEDDGPGIAAEAAGRIFTPFFTTKAGGTGLGLATARKALAGMGGEIALENRPGGRGAVLRLALPLAGGEA